MLKNSPLVHDPVIVFSCNRIRSLLGDRISEIILFGSRARGEGAERSDYDILVVVDNVTREVRDALDEAGSETLSSYGELVAPVPISVKNKAGPLTPLLLNIEREGVSL